MRQDQEDVVSFAAELQRRSSKILEERSVKRFVIGWDPLSMVHYTRPGTCINRPLH